jgi:thiamine-monophosphate kinase
MKKRPTPGKRTSRSSEDALVERIKAGTSSSQRSHLRLGVGDDAALFEPRQGYETILTCDWFLEGVHFLRDRHPADAVGWKCLARAVSDVAAMGGAPRCFLLSLALPPTHSGQWLAGFMHGLRRAARRFGCELAGGDTTRSARILVNVSVAGEVRRGRGVLRSGARSGDVVYVSGRLGEAELGLDLLRRRSRQRIEQRNPLLKKHLYPEPRLALGSWLAEHRLATAMMDLSDGLSTDLARLCGASRTGARLFAERIPKCAAGAAARGLRLDRLELALHGGDDYELLFTVRKSQLARIPKSFGGVPLTAIGEITRERGIVLTDRGGRSSQLHPGGWDPFAGK